MKLFSTREASHTVTGGLIWPGKLDRPRMTEAETGMRYLQSKERQGAEGPGRRKGQERPVSKPAQGAWL